MSVFENAAKAMRDTCRRAAAEMGMSVGEALAIFREHTAPTDDDWEAIFNAPAEPAVTDNAVRAALRVWYRGAWGGGWTPEHESRMRAALEAALSTERGE